jgi:nitrite reductase (NO-forming)
LVTKAIIHGLSGKITVNGKVYDGVMPKQTLSDAQIASVATFVLNSFGNKGGEVSPADVAKQRK